jgi:hypothetical protein
LLTARNTSNGAQLGRTHRTPRPSAFVADLHDPTRDPGNSILAIAGHVVCAAMPESAMSAWTLLAGRDELRVLLRGPAGNAIAPDEDLLACGAALENIRLTARHLGYETQVDLMPDGDLAPTVARVRLGGACTPTFEDEALFRAMEGGPLRIAQPCRGISPALIGLLRHAARAEGAWLTPLGAGTPRVQRWPWHAVIGTSGDEPSAWVRVGEALQRVRLHASLQGWRTTVVSMIAPAMAAFRSVPATRREPRVVARFDGSRDLRSVVPRPRLAFTV